MQENFWKSSFDNGVIPPGMKTQYITIVFKRGDRTSALTSLRYIFERVVRKHLWNIWSKTAFFLLISMDSALKH